MTFFYPGPIPYVNFIKYVNSVLGIPSSMIQVTFTYAPVPTDPGWKVTYSSQLTAAQISSIESLISNPSPFGGWTAPSAVPDYDGFRHDCITDTLAPAYPVALIYCLLAADPTLSSSDRGTLLDAAATAVTAAYPAEASAIISKVESYLISRNIPS